MHDTHGWISFDLVDVVAHFVLCLHYVFVDETHLNMQELIERYWRAIIGIPSINRGYFNRYSEPGCSSIAALSITRIISATILLVQINDAETFLSYLEHDLFPRMQPFPRPQSILCLDNARVYDKIRIYVLAQRFSIIVLFLPT